MTKKSNEAKRRLKQVVSSRRLWVVLLAALMVVGLLPVPLAQAATFTVDRNSLARFQCARIFA